MGAESAPSRHFRVSKSPALIGLKIWRQIARQISTNAHCQSSERRIAPLHSVTEYQLREVMDSSKARQKVECATASLVWVVGLTCFTRPSSNAPIKCVHQMRPMHHLLSTVAGIIVMKNYMVPLPNS